MYVGYVRALLIYHNCINIIKKCNHNRINVFKKDKTVQWIVIIQLLYAYCYGCCQCKMSLKINSDCMKEE